MCKSISRLKCGSVNCFSSTFWKLFILTRRGNWFTPTVAIKFILSYQSRFWRYNKTLVINHLKSLIYSTRVTSSHWAVMMTDSYQHSTSINFSMNSQLKWGKLKFTSIDTKMMVYKMWSNSQFELKVEVVASESVLHALGINFRRSHLYGGGRDLVNCDDNDTDTE